jgi:hypothetical protein
MPFVFTKNATPSGNKFSIGDGNFKNLFTASVGDLLCEVSIRGSKFLYTIFDTNCCNASIVKNTSGELTFSSYLAPCFPVVASAV